MLYEYSKICGLNLSAFVVPRVFTSDDPQDLIVVQKLIGGINVYPLAEFDGKMKFICPVNTTFTKQQIGTRYLFTAVRILANPNDPADNKRVHQLQDALKIEQKSIGKFEIPDWDPVSRKQVRAALLELNKTLPDLRNAGGGCDCKTPNCLPI